MRYVIVRPKMKRARFLQDRHPYKFSISWTSQIYAATIFVEYEAAESMMEEIEINCKPELFEQCKIKPLSEFASHEVDQ